MTIGIMQPYFFPYIGYWQLINAVDEWIFFDVVQYNKKSWMNRNRILHPDAKQEWQYVSVPVKKHEKGTLIKDIELNNDERWKEKILGQLTVYKRLKAPYYEETINLINSIFEKEYDIFLSLSIESTKMICSYFGIELKYKIASEIDFDRSEITGSGDWALVIAKDQKADRYINPHGGYEIFEEEKYNSNGIDLKFLKSNLTPYKQSWRKEFTPGLSIIDVMMFNSKEEIKSLLDADFKIFNKASLALELG